MKTRDLKKMFAEAGWWEHRKGSKHDTWTDGKHYESIVHHTETDESLAKALIRRYGLK